jgi:hypothetical protein
MRDQAAECFTRCADRATHPRDFQRAMSWSRGALAALEDALSSDEVRWRMMKRLARVFDDAMPVSILTADEVFADELVDYLVRQRNYFARSKPQLVQLMTSA